MKKLIEWWKTQRAYTKMVNVERYLRRRMAEIELRNLATRRYLDPPETALADAILLVQAVKRAL